MYSSNMIRRDFLWKFPLALASSVLISSTQDLSAFSEDITSKIRYFDQQFRKKRIYSLDSLALHYKLKPAAIAEMHALFSLNSVPGTNLYDVNFDIGSVSGKSIGKILVPIGKLVGLIPNTKAYLKAQIQFDNHGKNMFVPFRYVKLPNDFHADGPFDDYKHGKYPMVVTFEGDSLRYTGYAGGKRYDENVYGLENYFCPFSAVWNFFLGLFGGSDFNIGYVIANKDEMILRKLNTGFLHEPVENYNWHLKNDFAGMVKELYFNTFSSSQSGINLPVALSAREISNSDDDIIAEKLDAKLCGIEYSFR